MRLWEIIKMEDEGRLELNDIFNASNCPISFSIKYTEKEFIYNYVEFQEELKAKPVELNKCLLYEYYKFE